MAEPPKFDQARALKAISERYTPEKRAEDEERNKRLRSQINSNSAKERIARAAAQERDIQEQIEFLSHEKPSDLKTSRLHSALDRLGELAAEQGRYDEAIEVTQDAKRRRYYQSIKHAIERTDRCKCGPDHVIAPVMGTDGKVHTTDVTLPAMTVIGTVMHPDGHFVSLERCTCGELYTNA